MTTSNKSVVARRIVCLLVAAAVSFVLSGCQEPALPGPDELELFSPDLLDGWRLMQEYTGARPWVFEDDTFMASAWPGNWVIYEQPFADFELKCDFLFSSGQGGIVLRGADERQPWRSGYELDIDWAEKPTYGHIHLPASKRTLSE